MTRVIDSVKRPYFNRLKLNVHEAITRLHLRVWELEVYSEYDNTIFGSALLSLRRRRRIFDEISM